MLIAVLIGMMLDFLIGDPQTRLHPIRFVGYLISGLEKIIRKIFPKTKKGEYVAGVSMAIFVMLITAGIPLVILIFAYKINIFLYIGVESIMCYFLIATKSLKTESMKVYKALEDNDVEKARYEVSMIVGRDTENLDDKEITKATVETIAENTSDGVIAPLFYMVAGGAVLGFLLKAINTMDSMIGYKNEKYMYFGRFAAKLDDVVNFVPARLSALIMIISTVFINANTKNSWKIFKRDRFNHASPNSAQTESVAAGALNIQLAGDAYYFGKLSKKKTIGDPLKEIEHRDIVLMNRLLYVTTIMGFVFFALIKLILILIVLKGHM